MTASLRVGLAIETTGPGGAETMLLGLAEELRRGDHEVLAMVPRGGEEWLARQFVDRGFALEPLEFAGAFGLGTVRRLAAIIERRGLDVLHSHEFALAVYGGLAARWAGCPHVITLHGGLYFSERARRRLALRAAIFSSRRTVTVSEASRDVIARHLGIRPRRLAVVYNGVAPAPGERSRVRREVGAREGDVVVLAVGNLYPVKGHRFLIEAIAGLGGRRENVLLLLAGRGDQREALAELATRAGIADRVRFLGFRSDVADLLAGADVFAMPSLSEGLPMAVIEAMFAGKAIVASRVGGIPELLADGQHGLLVTAGDIAVLSRALEQVIADPELRRRLASAARERAEQEFTLRAMTQKYVDIYLDDRGRGRSGHS